ASGEAGFRRRPGARPRDLLLGFEALLADGTTVKAGGRVVKNVSGYEITKLLVGSRGTLALITRAHLRLRPLPETLLTLWVSFAGPGEISGAVSRLRGEAVEPQWMAVTDPSFGAVGSLEVWALWLRFEGLEEEVRWEAEKSRRILAPCEGLRAMESWDPGDSERRWQRLRDFPDPREHCAFAMVVRGQVVPSRALQLARSWQGIGPLVAYPDVGCVYVRSDDPSAYSRLLREARILGANAVLESGPPELKKEVDVFGESPGGFELMRKIKQTLDPKRVFSPGRFVGRL
ncbi:MAG: FAD-binding oxidoreductase, partial [Acidobacteriota bacterium]